MPTSTQSRPAEDARQDIQRRMDADIDHRSDAFVLYDTYDVQRLAHVAHKSFGTDKNGAPNRTQMRKLERVALSASTYGEILNYVKSQTGRATQEEWTDHRFGYDLHDRLEQIRTEAEGRADTLIDNIERRLLKALQRDDERKKDAEKRVQNWVKHEMRLRFTQRYVQHLVAEYVFVASDATNQ